MAFRRVEGVTPEGALFVILHKELTPTDADWRSYVADLKSLLEKRPDDLALMATLVLSDGGAPNAIQRTLITEVQERTSARAPVAFISDSPLIRGATRALAMFNPRFKVFAPDSFTKALTHLGVPLVNAATVKRHILETEQQLGGPKLRVVRAIFSRSGTD